MNNKSYLLGLDIGSSSIKAALIDTDSGEAIRVAQAPEKELPILSPQAGWAEQDPETWWKYAKEAIDKLFKDNPGKKDVQAIGISYQMHGLVMMDKNNKVLRPSIIWCDSRAASLGEEAFKDLGEDLCLTSLLNSPGNFTASKLAWVKNNEPEIYDQAKTFLLPGDYIAYRLTGQMGSTISGMSEGIFWDFKQSGISSRLLDYYGIESSLVPELLPSFGDQGQLSISVAGETGLKAGTPVSYRAGDQPNNALSLNVFNPGEVAATAGTSGVIYGILDKLNADSQSRVNLFAHVNHTPEKPSLGVLLCVNGTGIQYSWLRNQVFGGSIDYPEMNNLAASVREGSEGLSIFPFGNGVERILQNRPFGGKIHNLDFNRHGRAHLIRAAQEGIIFALNYGFETMQELGVKTQTVRAGDANMFQSELFCELFSSITGTRVELYNTDGAIGAARGAGIGAGYYKGPEEAFATLKTIKTISPNPELTEIYSELYDNWKTELEKIINNK